MQHKTQRIFNQSQSSAVCSGPAVQLAIAACLGLVGCGQSNAPQIGGLEQPLIAECVSDDALLPPDAWTCPETLSVECSGAGADPGTLYVLDSVTKCSDAELSVTPGPFGVGEHEITVSAPGTQVICRSELV